MKQETEKVIINNSALADEKLDAVQKVCQYLNTLGIKPYCLIHPEIVSCDESKIIYEGNNIDLNKNSLCKNIFVKDKKCENYFLIILDYKKRLDLSSLRWLLNTSKLSLANEEELTDILKVKSGSVSIFSLLNDLSDRVKLIIDEDLLTKETLAFHPNYSGLTFFIDQQDFRTIFNSSLSEREILELPTTNIEELNFSLDNNSCSKVLTI